MGPVGDFLDNLVPRFPKNRKLSKFPPKPWRGSAGTWLPGIGCGASGDTMEALKEAGWQTIRNARVYQKNSWTKWRKTPFFFECWAAELVFMICFLGVFFKKNNSELLLKNPSKTPKNFHQKSLHSESICWSQSTPIFLGARLLKSPSLGLAMKLLSRDSGRKPHQMRKKIADILVYS